MRNFYILLIIVLSLINICFAQNVGIGTSTPNASSILEIKASDKGLLIPRTSSTSRTAISNPANGLMVYDTTTSSFWYHNGSTWTEIGNATGASWNIGGNANTDSSANFIGTTNAQALVFKINNLKSGFIGYGTSNTSFGYQSLISNTIGNYNTATGTDALLTNTIGSSNTAAGSYSLLNNTTGSSNTATGSDALHQNNTGSSNTGLGAGSLYSNTQGTGNTAAGFHSLLNNVTGINNTAVGTNALSSITSGSTNTSIGAGADIFNGSFSNATAIGANAIAPAPNSIQLGDNNVSNIYSNNNCNIWIGNAFIKGNGIVRNTSSLQLKMSSGSYVVSTTINALSTISIPFNFNETFSTVPVVYVGNITGGPGGFAEVIMSIANVTTTGAVLFVSNPRNSAIAPSYTVNIVAIGGE